MDAIVDNNKRIEVGDGLRVSHVLPDGYELLFDFTHEGVIIDTIPPMEIVDSSGATLGMTYDEFADWLLMYWGGVT